MDPSESGENPGFGGSLRAVNEGRRNLVQRLQEATLTMALGERVMGADG
jgi:hypothetical protein